MINFKLHLYFPWWVGVGVVIIRNKASQSNLTGTGTELGNISWSVIDKAPDFSKLFTACRHKKFKTLEKT